jgi:hypothetical protein
MDSTEKLQPADDYDASALAYEEHWGLALAVLAEDFVESVPLSDAERILDVGARHGADAGVPQPTYVRGRLRDRPQARTL